jgi:hypothetical protein
MSRRGGDHALEQAADKKAGSMDEVLGAASLRGQIARFLHQRKDDEH